MVKTGMVGGGDDKRYYKSVIGNQGSPMTPPISSFLVVSFMTKYLFFGYLLTVFGVMFGFILRSFKYTHFSCSLVWNY